MYNSKFENTFMGGQLNLNDAYTNKLYYRIMDNLKKDITGK
jgi:hypothetical protein